MRCRLVPCWAKDIKTGFSTIYAMPDTVDTKPVPGGLVGRKGVRKAAEILASGIALAGSSPGKAIFGSDIRGN